MKTTALLKENSETTEIEDRAAQSESEHDESAGCTCDRWGHPCKDCAHQKTEKAIVSAAGGSSHSDDREIPSVIVRTRV
jgi:hypothetical protein